MGARSGRSSIAISKGRFEAFSDGVFAIAITLLVLEFRPPDFKSVADANAGLASALLASWPDYVVYAASFATIGIMWFNHYALFHNAKSVSYGALIANLLLLLFVCFLPFPTLILGRYGVLPPAVAFYGLTFVALAICFNILWYSATLKPGQRGSLIGFLSTRTAWNTAGTVVYAIATGIAYISPFSSIALIAAMAVYYMLPWSVRSVLAATEVTRANDVAGP